MAFSFRNFLSRCLHTFFSGFLLFLTMVPCSSRAVSGAPPVPADTVTQAVLPDSPPSAADAPSGVDTALSQDTASNDTARTGTADTTHTGTLDVRTPSGLRSDTIALQSPKPPDSLRQASITSGKDEPPSDSTGVKDGRYLAAGIGWSLGSFELLSLWENALPDSLAHLGLSATSFSVPFDSSLNNSESVDTALLTFAIKEAPVVYTMSFPVRIGMVRLRGNNRFGFSVSGSWMRKLFTATIAAKADSLIQKVDFKESINVYSLFCSFLWGHRIPEEYFSIDGVGRSYFTAALDVSPLIAVTIRRTAATAAPGTRFTEVKNHIATPPSRFLHGGAAAVRLGLTMVRRLNASSATDFGIWYSIQGYGYFHEKGNRVYFTGIDPSATRKERPLFWISNRLELSFSLLHSRKRNDP
jgi:hypothetical protein